MAFRDHLGASLGCLGLFTACAFGEPPPASPGTDAGEATASTEAPRDLSAAGGSAHEINLSFTGYAWLTSFNGTAGVRGVEADVDESFIDILNNSDSIFGLMGSLDLDVNRFVFQFNGAYTRAEFDQSRGVARSGPLDSSASVRATINTTVESAWLEFFAGYRLLEMPLGEQKTAGLQVDAFAGFRYTTLDFDTSVTADADITLPGGTDLSAGDRRDIGGDEGWFEPFIGVRAGLKITEHWRLSLRGDVGGFDVDHSAFAWQVLAAAGYEWRMDGWRLGLFGGYRALGQDFEKNGVVWDVVTHGPIMGFRAGFDF